MKGRPSQQRGIWSAINKERGGRQYFGMLTVKLISELRAASSLITPSSKNNRSMRENDVGSSLFQIIWGES
jgi:hypothetical protein